MAVASRVEQKAEFGLRGGGLRMFYAESKNFLCRRRQSGGGDIFFQATCLYVTIDSQFCGVKTEAELNISVICGGGADTKQNF